MGSDADDRIAVFRERLRWLHSEVRSPAYRRLAELAARDGAALASSTTGTLLNGPGTPRWETVATFVRACARHARAQRVVVPADGLDLDVWHAEYRRMESAAAEKPAVPGGRRARSGRRAVVPAMLPADLAAFAGRGHHLTELDRLLERAAESAGRTSPSGTAPGGSPAVVISAVAGMAGVGKTALAVRWAHRVRDRFPDGQLYVNLRGFDPGKQPMTPDEAVRNFLDALEVSPHRIPVGLDAQAGLYRSLLADRRMLVLLDNASDSGQVRPLLPGAPGCVVVVTSRNRLDGLVTLDGARPLALDLLSVAEAGQLLAARLGAERVAREAAAVEQIIADCARLPLALAIVAGRAAVHPQFTLADLAGQLSRARGGLGALAGGDDPYSDLRAVFSWSYQTLSRDATRLFRLLGIHPGQEVSAPAAASLAGVPVPRAEDLLSELTRASLLIEQTPGRYTFHDLLRRYATEQAYGQESAEERRAATHRLLDYYLHSAYAGAVQLSPHRNLITLSPPVAGVTTHDLAGHDQALAWFSAQYAVLLAAVEHAAATGFDNHAWQLAWTLADFLERLGLRHEWVAAQQTATVATSRLADPIAQAHSHRILGRAYVSLGRFDESAAQLRQALDLHGRAGDQIGLAEVHRSLALLASRQDHYAEALDHARQALDLYRACGHRRGQAQTFGDIGWYHAHLGDYEQGLAFCEQALSRCEEVGDRIVEAGIWDSLGYAHHHLGHDPQAIDSYRHALRMYQDLGDRYYEAGTLTNLGDTHHAAGDPDAAGDAWRRALSILDDLDHPDAQHVRAKLRDLGQPATPTTTAPAADSR